MIDSDYFYMKLFLFLQTSEWENTFLLLGNEKVLAFIKWSKSPFQENRCFRFRFFDNAESSNKHATAQQFFRDLVSVFPRGNFIFKEKVIFI